MNLPDAIDAAPSFRCLAGCADDRKRARGCQTNAMGKAVDDPTRGEPVVPRIPRTWMSAEQTRHQLLACDVEVGRDFLHDHAQLSDLRSVVGSDSYEALNPLVDFHPTLLRA